MIIDVFLSETCFMWAGLCRFSVRPGAKRRRHPRRTCLPCFCGVKPLVCRRPSNNVTQQQRSRRCPTQMLQSPTAYFFECSIFLKCKLKKMADAGGEQIDEKSQPDPTGPTESPLHSSRVNKTPFLVSHHMINLVFYTPPRIHKALICIFSIFLECFALPVLFIAPHLKCGGYV